MVDPPLKWWAIFGRPSGTCLELGEMGKDVKDLKDLKDLEDG